MARYSKPALPVINWRNPITRELLYAVSPGWDRGLRFGGNTVTRSAKNLVEGTANGAAPVLGVARVLEFGWGLCSSNDSWYQYPSVSIPTVIGSGGITLAALVQPLVVPPSLSPNRRVFQKRASGAPTDPGVDMFIDTANLPLPAGVGWSFEWSDGVAEQTLKTLTPPPQVNTIALLTATLNPQDNVARLFVDGVQQVETALLVIPVNPIAQPVSICGGIGPIGDKGGDNCVGMAAAWNRALSPREITDLWADPHRMFKRR